MHSWLQWLVTGLYGYMEMNGLNESDNIPEATMFALCLYEYGLVRDILAKLAPMIPLIINIKIKKRRRRNLHVARVLRILTHHKRGS